MIRKSYVFVTLLAAAVLPAMSSAAGAKGGAVFVMTNAAEKNEVIAFERTSDGLLFDGGRYSTGGRGSGGVTDPLGAQGAIQLSQDHSLLLAINAASGSVSVFRVKKSALTLVDKAPAGALPVAVAQWHNFVYVLNSGGPGSVVGFKLGSDDTLKKITNSIVYLTANSTGASSISISPDGQFLAVTEKAPNNIDLFRIKADGTLTAIVVNHSSVPGVFAAVFGPKNILIDSETGPASGTNASTVSAYSIQSNLTLSPISIALPTLGAANCWNAVAPNGKWVYVSNSASSTISGFVIAKSGALKPIGGTVVGINPMGSTSLDLAVTADSSYLYSLDSSAGKVGIFAIDADGSLTRLGDAGDLPKASGFTGIAAY